MGPTLAVSDLAKIDRKQKELEEAYTKLIAEDKILTEAGINDYAAFEQTEEEFHMASASARYKTMSQLT